jgi:rubrerythrin
MEYYRAVAGEATDAELRRLAGEFAAEENEHVAALDQWIGRTPRPSETWARDPVQRS